MRFDWATGQARDVLMTEFWPCLRQDKFCFRQSKGENLSDLQVRGLVGY